MKMRGVEDKSESNEVRCWGENPQTQMLRLELRDGSFHLFPYASLERAQYSPAESADNLTLTFSDKSASITGRQLRELGMALQRMTVEWVKEQPEKYQGDEPSVFVQKIELKLVERD